MLARGLRVLILLILVLGCSGCPSEPGDTDTMAGELAGQHLLGKKLTVYNYPLDKPVLKKVAVHTYPVAYEDNDKRHAWKALGGSTGGTVLADTTTECGADCVDISTVNYVMSEAPCIWPYKPYYAVVGVCWNATNRGLYYTGKTVHKVKFYALVEGWFGTYGLDKDSTCFRQKCRDGRRLYGWSKCLASQKKKFPWQPKATLESTGIVDPRIDLFERYFGEQADRSLSALEPEARHSAYLTTLFDLNIDQKIGEEMNDELRAQLQNVREEMSMQMARLDVPEDDHESRLNSTNEIFNAALKKYAELLTDEQYQRLFDATKDEVYDIRIN